MKKRRTEKADEFQIDADRGATRASTAIFVIICALPVLTTLVYGGVDTIVLGLQAVIAALLVILWVADAWVTSGFRYSSNLLQLPIVALVLIGLVQLLPLGEPGIASGVLSIDPARSLSFDPFATRFFTIRLGIYLIFFAAALAFVDFEKRAKRLVVLIVIFGALIAFFGILQRLANPEGIYGIRATPQAIPFGPFVNQHHFAGFMEMTFGLTFGLILGGGKRDRKPFLLIAAVLMAMALIFTGSRGGVLSFAGVIAFGVGATYLFGGRQADTKKSNVGSNKFAAVAIATAIALVVIGSVFYLGAGDSLLRGVGLSQGVVDVSSGRIHFWQVAMQIFAANPVLGAGLDAFAVAFSRFDTQNGFFRVENAHNEYLQILAEAGVIGLIVVIGFLFLLFRQGLRTIANSHDALMRSIAVGALAGCFGIVIHSFFDFPLRTPSNALYFMLLCVLATSTFAGRRST